MKRIRMMWSLSLVCAAVMASFVGVATGADKALAVVSAEAPPTRVTDQPNAVLLALKQNDFAALLAAVEYDKDIVEIARQWDESAELHREIQAKLANEIVADTDTDAAATADDTMQQAWIKLQSAEGVDALVAEWQPIIAEQAGDSLMKFNLGFGALLMEIANDKEMNATEMQQMTQLMYAVQGWTGRVDFADGERLRRALQAVSKLVRQTGLKQFGDIRGLYFEDAVVHGDSLIATAKQVLAAYDLPIDEMLNSVRLSEVDAHEDKATLRLEARLLGVNVSEDIERQYYNGTWMDPDLAKALMKRPPEFGVDADSNEAQIEALIDAEAPPPPPPESASYSCTPDGAAEAGASSEEAVE
jgi:hypothetical protein